jgi:uncharacterized protein YggU (UPF0235/DUF167 family)
MELQTLLPMMPLTNLVSQLPPDKEPNTRTGQADANALHKLGLSPALLDNLRLDLKAVANGSRPDRALNNVLAGLEHLLRSDQARAKEWPAGKGMPEGGKAFVIGEDGKPKEVPLAKERVGGKLSEDSIALVKGEDGKPKEVPLAKERVGGKLSEASLALVKGEDGNPKEAPVAKKWVGGKLPEDSIAIVKGEDGNPKEVPAAKEGAGGKLPEDSIAIVKGEDGRPKEVEASTAQRNEPGNLRSSADAVVSELKALLDAEASGADVTQQLADLRSALKALDQHSLSGDNPVRDALQKSIRSLA